MQNSLMASQIAGGLQTTTLDSRMQVRVGVSRKVVKRRFLWRLGMERSCSEESIGSPRWVTALVFIEKGEGLKKIYCSLPAIGGEMVSGGQNPVQALRPSPAGLEMNWLSIG